MSDRMKKALEAFWTFFKIGLFTFGGGYAMIGIIEGECVEKRKWITSDELSMVTAIAESTPGPIAINCATYTGYRVAGILGSVAATLGVVLPSFIIIYLISLFLDNFLEIPIIANAFLGIKIGVGVIIAQAAVNMIRKMKKTPLSVAILVAAAALMLAVDLFALNFSTIWMILIAAVIGAAVYAICGRKEGKA